MKPTLPTAMDFGALVRDVYKCLLRNGMEAQAKEFHFKAMCAGSYTKAYILAQGYVNFI